MFYWVCNEGGQWQTYTNGFFCLSSWFVNSLFRQTKKLKIRYQKKKSQEVKQESTVLSETTYCKTSSASGGWRMSRRRSRVLRFCEVKSPIPHQPAVLYLLYLHLPGKTNLIKPSKNNKCN